MILATFVERRYIPSRVRLSARYRQALATIVEQWSRWLGRPATVEDFSEESILGFLASRSETDRATSINSYRKRLLSLWQAAYDWDLIDRPPRRRLVRNIPEDDTPPVAWTVDDVSKLLDYTASLTGSVETIPASLYWLSLFMAVYWTGCRISALLRTPAAAYDGSGLLVATQKNHRGQWYRLHATACESINATWPVGRTMLWPWPHCPRHLWTVARSIIEAAGLDAPKESKSLFQKLRRTTLTYCAAVDQSLAVRQAGHRSYATTARYYIDPRILPVQSAADALPVPSQSIIANPQLRIYG